MALGFTSHYAKNEHPFGTLTIGSSESETAGSVAYSDTNTCGLMLSVPSYDSCEFSVSVNIDYSQYAGYIVSSGSTETAGSVATINGSFSSGTVSVGSFSTGGCSSGGGASCASYTC